MQLQRTIQQISRTTNTLQDVIEKDFALGYVLAGIANHPILKDTLIFKGGTALKKCYFGEYRFSEDLDFSTLDAPKLKKLEKALQEALEITGKLQNKHGPFILALTRYTEKQPHPKDQEAFKIGVQFPWQRRICCQIKIEVSHHEPVLLEPVPRTLIHSYPDAINAEIKCYSLDEVVAEKMRTLLQSHQKLVANTWHRPRARDYYDLWHIFNQFGQELNSARLPQLLEQKASYAEVNFKTLDDFFTQELSTEAETNWQSNLGAFVKDLPDCQQVLTELKQLIPQYIPNL